MAKPSGTWSPVRYLSASKVEHNVSCVVVGFIADMDLAEKKGIKGLDKAGPSPR